MQTLPKIRILAAVIAALVSSAALASSHAEAPLITATPKVDGSDFYLFRSYETGREGFVTLIANYLPRQIPTGGPNFYQLDQEAVYDIKVDNNGDAVEDVTFQFRFTNTARNLTIPVGGSSVPVPLVNIGAFGPGREQGDEVRNVIETFSVSMQRGTRRSRPTLLSNAQTGETTFRKPFDNIGMKSIPDYVAYANNHVYNVELAGCGQGRVFVGQRQDAFVFNIGEGFDLVNTNPLGPVDGETNPVDTLNVTSLALEVPISCLTASNSPIIGAWTTASSARGNGRGSLKQVSRLSAPLVNEVVIGYPDKDKFNASEPRADAQFARYVTNPTLPELLEILFAAPAPNLFPRTDLVAAFLTGVEGLNKPANVRPAEMMRLNTSISPVPAASQNVLGVIAGDNAGFPNGRRPGDDVIDIALRVMMGKLLPADVAPAGQLPFTDGALSDPTDYGTSFPYLNPPLSPSPSN